MLIFRINFFCGAIFDKQVFSMKIVKFTNYRVIQIDVRLPFIKKKIELLGILAVFFRIKETSFGSAM